MVSLPGGVFTQAGAGVKTNLLFFTKGEPTESTWYYDLSELKITKRKPLTLEYFEDFFTPAAETRRQRTELDGGHGRPQGTGHRRSQAVPRPGAGEKASSGTLERTAQRVAAQVSAVCKVG